MGFFKSFFSGKPANPEEEKQKNNQKNFEIFKYDGMRAQRMGRADYANSHPSGQLQEIQRVYESLKTVHLLPAALRRSP